MNTIREDSRIEAESPQDQDYTTEEKAKNPQRQTEASNQLSMAVEAMSQVTTAMQEIIQSIAPMSPTIPNADVKRPPQAPAKPKRSLERLSFLFFTLAIMFTAFAAAVVLLGLLSLVLFNKAQLNQVSDSMATDLITFVATSVSISALAITIRFSLHRTRSKPPKN